MAILIAGLTTCPLCGEPIESAAGAVLLPAFAWGATDPLWEFSDGSFHESCFASHPRRLEVERIVAELLARTGPGRRPCAECGREIVDHDDYLLIPRLTDDEQNPLFGFRYTHLHKSHVSRWEPSQQLVELLRELAVVSEEPHIDWLLKELL